jgi:hypothetical protein
MNRSWLLVFAVAWLSFAAQPAAAEGSVEMNVNIPFGGVFKYDAWIRLEVTVQTRDQPFSGFIELSRDNAPRQMRHSTLRQEVKLAAGKSRTIAFDMPAEMNLDEWQLRLTQGEKVVTSEKLRLPYPKDGRIIGVLDSGSGAFHVLAMTQRQMNGGHVIVQNLTAEMLPDEAWLYRNLDILALRGEQVKGLRDRQVGAIKDWVKSGGVVILSAGPGQEEAVRRFADVLPIEPKSGRVDPKKALSGYTAAKTLPAGSIPVFNSALPLFVSRETGEGLLLFVNYDVTAEPLASWQHSAELWQNVLHRHGVLDVLEQGQRVDQLNRPLLELSRYIPDVHPPAPVWIAVLWVLYVAAVAPGTYLILKRLNRRQWAWGVIPGTAVLLMVGVFFIGKPMVVRENTSHAVTRIRILDGHLAEVESASTFLAVSGNRFEAEVQPGMVALPLAYNGNDYEPDGLTAKRAADAGYSLGFQGVPYLTPRQAVGFGLMREAGEFEASLHVQKDRLRGTLTNNTTFPLETAYIEVGPQRIPLGSMRPGETKRIDAKLEPLYLPSQNASGETSAEERIRRLQDDVLSFEGSDRVRIMGVNRQPLPLISLQQEHRSRYWNVISQTVRLQPDQRGVITYPYGMLGVDMHESTGELDSKSPYLWELAKGSVTFSLKLGQARNHAERLIVPLDHSSFRPFQKAIFHQKSGQWRSLPRDKRLVLEADLSEYLTPDGTVLIRFSHPGAQRLSLPMPFFQVEGREPIRHD